VNGGAGELFTAAAFGLTRSEGLNSPSLRWSFLGESAQAVAWAQLQGKGALAKATRYLFADEIGSRHEIAVVDAAGQPVLRITADKQKATTTISVARGDGLQLGAFVHEAAGAWSELRHVFKHGPRTRFAVVAGARPVGDVHQPDDTAPHLVVRDPSGVDVARLDRSTRRELHGIRPIVHHDYRVELLRPMDGALRNLLVAAPLVHDLMFAPDKNDSVFL
jgi:hypothetical protein